MFNHLHQALVWILTLRNYTEKEGGRGMSSNLIVVTLLNAGSVALWSGFLVLWVVLFVWVGFFLLVCSLVLRTEPVPRACQAHSSTTNQHT